MGAYSQDLRERALNALSRGETVESIALRLEVSKGWVYKVRARFRKEGERRPKRVGGYRRSRIEAVKAEVCGWIEEQPDLTLAEICQRLESDQQIHLGISALWHQLRCWGLRYKKNTARERTAT